MTNVFFGKGADFSTYDKLLRENEQKVRKLRIAQAEEALQQLKQEIDNRIAKLNEILTFSETNHAHYEQLTQQYQTRPTQTLAAELTQLRKTIDEVDKALEQAQPEKCIADLSTRYEELKSELAQKKTMTQNAEASDMIAEPSTKGLPK